MKKLAFWCLGLEISLRGRGAGFGGGIFPEDLDILKGKKPVGLGEVKPWFWGDLMIWWNWLWRFCSQQNQCDLYVTS